MKKLFFISLFFVIWSCKKKVPQLDFPQEHYCEKFAGKYDMYDPLKDEHYEMVCSCILNEDEYFDTMQFFNYADRFDFNYQIGIYGDVKLSIVPSVIIHPLVDQNNYKTTFSIGGFSYYPPKNIIRNDSIYISFTINNLAYYASDGVPWEVCEDCLHYGVKVH